MSLITVAPVVSPVGQADITQLVIHDINDTTRSQRDEIAYDALNVNGQAAGFTWNDPATGLLQCKLTSSVFPPMANPDRVWVHAYSGEGRQISSAWGPNNDMYTCIVMDPTSGSGVAIDYQLGGTPSNSRTIPFSEARFSFLLSPGNEQIIVGITSGGILRRWSTATDDWDDDLADLATPGMFPYSWTTRGGPAWFQITGDETYCTAALVQDVSFTAIELATSIITTSTDAGADEAYGMESNVAITGTSPSGVWSIVPNTYLTHRTGSGDDGVLPGNGIFHTIAAYDYNNGNPTGGFVVHYDINTVSGGYGMRQVFSDGTVSAMVVLRPYIAGMHACNYACKGINNLWRMAVMGQYGAQIPSTDGYDESMFLVDPVTGDKYELPHTYANWQSGTDLGNGAGSQQYYDQPKPHISDDGKIIMHTSNMNGNDRYDVVITELPLTA